MQRRSTLGMIRSGITDPESWRRSTVSMVTSFVLGITFSHEILVKLRRPFGTALRASASISLKFHSKMLPKKKPVTLATAAVRHPRPSAYLTRSLTLTLTNIKVLFKKTRSRFFVGKITLPYVLQQVLLDPGLGFGPPPIKNS